MISGTSTSESATRCCVYCASDSRGWCTDSSANPHPNPHPTPTSTPTPTPTQPEPEPGAPTARWRPAAVAPRHQLAPPHLPLPLPPRPLPAGARLAALVRLHGRTACGLSAASARAGPHGQPAAERSARHVGVGVPAARVSSPLTLTRAPTLNPNPAGARHLAHPIPIPNQNPNPRS